jgi:hypothetical protein
VLMPQVRLRSLDANLGFSVKKLKPLAQPFACEVSLRLQSAVKGSK